MAMTEKQRLAIIKYCEMNDIDCQQKSPQTFTSSVNEHANHLIITFKNKEQLHEFTQQICDWNRDPPHIQTSIIGGGRGGHNNSYSIAQLWEGTDVFMQLAWEPTVTIQTNNSESPEEKTCRISPNMMLTELNKQLYDSDLHCPLLFGTLPYMSIAGGLATNSHTAYGYLADAVVGLEVLLPNGSYQYFKKGDPDFDLLCNNMTVGLFGVVTAVDIKVEPGRKKLQRTVEFSTYAHVMDRTVKDKAPLNSRGIIFSPNPLNDNTRVKITKWAWVDATTPDTGTSETPDTLSQPTTSLAKHLAQSHPRKMSSLFQTTRMSTRSAGTVVKHPCEVMGPESKLSGDVTDMSVFFDYDAGKMDDFLKHLEKLIADESKEKRYPVNTAFFIRFPKNGDKQRVAIDATSFGLRLQEMQPLFHKIASYLQEQGMNPSLHAGKTSGISMNKQLSEKSWSALKKRYAAFYKKHHLNIHDLNRKVASLEQPSTIRIKIDEIFLALEKSDDPMAIVQACAEFGAELQAAYPHQTLDEILAEFKEFEEYRARTLSVDSCFAIHTLVAEMKRQKTDHEHAAACDALGKGLNIFQSLLNPDELKLQIHTSVPDKPTSDAIHLLIALHQLKEATDQTTDDSIRPMGLKMLNDIEKLIKTHTIPPKDLPKLAQFVEGTARVISDPSPTTLNQHIQNIAEIKGIDHEWAKIVGGSMVAVLGIITIALGITLAVGSFGVIPAAVCPIIAFAINYQLAGLGIALTLFSGGTGVAAKSAIYTHEQNKGKLAEEGEMISHLTQPK